ncbi:lipopolysaccharide biosynthesis protein [Thioflavicoccus mobilis]|nr:lipopolysaccharide biosynthesis protein [Thioflavicoccus mobilis]
MGDLKGRSVRGGAVTLTAQAIKFALNLGSTMILARLLAPSDFGLIAMVTVVTGFVAMFKDAGLSMATVQRKDITHEQVSMLFWINVALSVGVMLLLAAFAPAIAAFYSEPRLVWITVALAGTMLFGGLTVQHQAILRRQMRFKALARIEIISMASGIALAVAMALAGVGYWSLVGMVAGTAIANAMLVWIFCNWRPSMPQCGTEVAELVKFGGGLTGFSFLNYFTRNADNVIVGYALGSGPLGIYSKAYNLLMLPIRQINAPIGSVMLPVLSRLQDDPARYRSAYLQALSAIAMVGTPIVVTAFVLADELVAILLGPGWEEAATVFRWLAPAAFFGTVNVAPGWLCISLGRPGTQLRWAMISAPVTVVAFLIGVQWGIVGVAAAFSASWCLGFYIFVVMACRKSPVQQRDIAHALLAPITASLIAAIVGMVTHAEVSAAISSPLSRALVTLPGMGLVGISVLYLFPMSRIQLNNLLREGICNVAIRRSHRS